MGETVTTVIPVFELKYVMEMMQTIDIGGRDVTNYLQKLLCDRGYPLEGFKGLLLCVCME